MSTKLDKGILLIQSFETAADRVVSGTMAIVIPVPANVPADEKIGDSIFRTTKK